MEQSKPHSDVAAVNNAGITVRASHGRLMGVALGDTCCARADGFGLSLLGFCLRDGSSGSRIDKPDASIINLLLLDAHQPRHSRCFCVAASLARYVGCFIARTLADGAAHAAPAY